MGTFAHGFELMIILWARTPVALSFRQLWRSVNTKDRWPRSNYGDSLRLRDLTAWRWPCRTSPIMDIIPQGPWSVRFGCRCRQDSASTAINWSRQLGSPATSHRGLRILQGDNGKEGFAGRASESGVLACLLARRADGRQTIFEGEVGFAIP
jgi:hypothetical protein